MEIDDRYPLMRVPIVGTISSFGGPEDTGMTETEGLALYPGLGRDLDPNDMYCAMRWNYSITSKEFLRHCHVWVCKEIGQNVATVKLKPMDWGPHERTGRLIDISPGAMKALNAKTDDIVCCYLTDV